MIRLIACCLMIKVENIICWNCRGASSGNFVRVMKELLRSYKPALVVLLKLKISGAVADRICKQIGMSRWGYSEATGFSCGIWVLWNEDMIRVAVKHVQKYFIRPPCYKSIGWEAVGADDNVCQSQHQRKKETLGEIG